MSKFYRVSTQGDCEGRTRRDLGIWQGDVGEIIMTLGNKQAYYLDIEEIQINTPGQPTKETVEAQFSSHFTEEQVRNMKYCQSTHKSRFALTATFSLDDEHNHKLRVKQALDKLSPEERQLLGV